MNDRCVEEDATRTVTVLSEEAAPETVKLYTEITLKGFRKK